MHYIVLYVFLLLIKKLFVLSKYCDEIYIKGHVLPRVYHHVRLSMINSTPLHLAICTVKLSAKLEWALVHWGGWIYHGQFHVVTKELLFMQICESYVLAEHNPIYQNKFNTWCIKLLRLFTEKNHSKWYNIKIRKYTFLNTKPYRHC